MSKNIALRPLFQKSAWVGLLAVALLNATDTKAAGSTDAASQYNLDKSRLALAGHDPVAYFTLGKASKGRRDLALQRNGITYQFATAEDQALFEKEPAKYMPAYGGWCATAMAKGEKVEVDPANFKITQGRLFLFFKAFYDNALKDWVKDEPAQTAKADAHWKRIAGE
ncbi:MAG: YHS domain protein [Verrucomicrobia bacterium]|nr:YHS domain protein [Verrucomicrobiota bacterium]MBI3868191.1 YHS domain protein [Verrucomicrobiota bacterium]